MMGNSPGVGDMYGYGSPLSETSVLLTLANPADTMLSMAIGTISVSMRNLFFINLFTYIF